MGQRGLQAAENRLAMFHKGEEEGGASECRPGKFRAWCPSLLDPP